MPGDKEDLNLSTSCVSYFLCDLGPRKNRDDDNDTNNSYLVWWGNAGKILALCLEGRGAWSMLASIIEESDGKVCWITQKKKKDLIQRIGCFQNCWRARGVRIRGSYHSCSGLLLKFGKPGSRGNCRRSQRPAVLRQVLGGNPRCQAFCQLVPGSRVCRLPPISQVLCAWLSMVESSWQQTWWQGVLGNVVQYEG